MVVLRISFKTYDNYYHDDFSWKTDLKKRLSVGVVFIRYQYSAIAEWKKSEHDTKKRHTTQTSAPIRPILTSCFPSACANERQPWIRNLNGFNNDKSQQPKNLTNENVESNNSRYHCLNSICENWLWWCLNVLLNQPVYCWENQYYTQLMM